MPSDWGPIPGSKEKAGAKSEFHWVNHVVMSQNGRHALLSVRRVKSTPKAGEYRLEWWDLAEGKRLAVWNEATPEKDLYWITVVANGRFALTQSYRQDSKVWNVADGKIKETLPSRFDRPRSEVLELTADVLSPMANGIGKPS
jgi:hypothetical protein